MTEVKLYPEAKADLKLALKVLKDIPENGYNQNSYNQNSFSGDSVCMLGWMLRKEYEAGTRLSEEVLQTGTLANKLFSTEAFAPFTGKKVTTIMVAKRIKEIIRDHT